MKKSKKLLSLLLAALTVCALCVPAFAAESAEAAAPSAAETARAVNPPDSTNGQAVQVPSYHYVVYYQGGGQTSYDEYTTLVVPVGYVVTWSLDEDTAVEVKNDGTYNGQAVDKIIRTSYVYQFVKKS